MGDFSLSALPRFRRRRFLSPDSADARAPVAISSCLAGQRVRYDGASKSFAAAALLDQALHLISICPEVGAGFSVPRPPVQLVNTDLGIRARGRDDATLDVTSALQHYAERSTQIFQHPQTLCGYIWKSRSPSCGFASAPVFDPSNRQIAIASGIQARHFQRQLPWLHCCEESDLTSVRAISVYVLICRVVFDLLRAAADVSAAAHRHYHFLQRCLSIETQECLNELSERGPAIEYLIATKVACARMDQEELLELFLE